MTHIKKYKVLLVDDNKDFLKALICQLKEIIGERLEIIDTSLNGCEAIEMVKMKVYDIIFMDIDMPVMDGIITTKYFKIRYPYLKIIAMSFHDDISRIYEMIQAGSSFFISKTDLNEGHIRDIFNA